jgi:hypothetical protein
LVSRKLPVTTVAKTLLGLQTHAMKFVFLQKQGTFLVFHLPGVSVNLEVVMQSDRDVPVESATAAVIYWCGCRGDSPVSIMPFQAMGQTCG